ncbi:hypothetical protein GJU40_15120 [Bacillus lacus]|uniref:NAD(P)-dependent oxidoreductase n=1 Tax=Metabacillus lacus TaxID=1983721 RepID=A0A7X2J119_9BACI|nr:hypothetical protein [Metabacillus lacus]MRX73473.1 hypothetical protein [Metabacillus lacus]
MESVLLYGAETYVGFLLAERLLEEGIHVAGIYLAPGLKEEQNMLEERMLMIGRNAGLARYDAGETNKIPAEKYDHIIDASLDPNSTNSQAVHAAGAIEAAAKHHLPYTLLSCSQLTFEDEPFFADRRYRHSEESLQQFHLAEKAVRESGLSRGYKIIRLPLLAGPWQSYSSKLSDLLMNDEHLSERVIKYLLPADQGAEAVFLLLNQKNQITTVTSKEWISGKRFSERKEKELYMVPADEEQKKKAVHSQREWLSKNRISFK